MSNMIERKDYLINKIDGELSDNMYLKFVLLQANNNKPHCFQLHKSIFEDIKVLADRKLQKRTKFIGRFSYFLSHFNATLGYESFTTDYFFHLKNNYPINFNNANIIYLQFDYLYFLLKLYNLLSNDSKLESFIEKQILTQTLYLGSNGIIRNFKKYIETEIKDKKRIADGNCCLGYYLKHRKDIV